VGYVSEQESVEVKAPELEQEQLQGLLSYLSSSFERAYAAVEPGAYEFRSAIANGNDMDDDDKTINAFKLGYINGLAYALHLLAFNGAIEGLLNKPEYIARFLSAMSRLFKLYNEYSAGQRKGWLDVYDGITGVSNELEELIRDVARQLKVQE
jgi:hypothetical protein